MCNLRHYNGLDTKPNAVYRGKSLCARRMETAVFPQNSQTETAEAGKGGKALLYRPALCNRVKGRSGLCRE